MKPLAGSRESPLLRGSPEPSIENDRAVGVHRDQARDVLRVGAAARECVRQKRKVPFVSVQGAPAWAPIDDRRSAAEEGERRRVHSDRHDRCLRWADARTAPLGRFGLKGGRSAGRPGSLSVGAQRWPLPEAHGASARSGTARTRERSPTRARLRNGRGDWIRTSDLFVPNEARYQTAPRPGMRRGAQYAPRPRSRQPPLVGAANPSVPRLPLRRGPPAGPGGGCIAGADRRSGRARLARWPRPACCGLVRGWRWLTDAARRPSSRAPGLGARRDRRRLARRGRRAGPLRSAGTATRARSVDRAAASARRPGARDLRTGDSRVRQRRDLRDRAASPIATSSSAKPAAAPARAPRRSRSCRACSACRASPTPCRSDTCPKTTGSTSGG